MPITQVISEILTCLNWQGDYKASLWPSNTDISLDLQAEFGDHDPEKHTAEYLADFPLLPKPMVSQFEDRLGALTDAVGVQGGGQQVNLPFVFR